MTDEKARLDVYCSCGEQLIMVSIIDYGSGISHIEALPCNDCMDDYTRCGYESGYENGYDDGSKGRKGEEWFQNKNKIIEFTKKEQKDDNAQ